MSWEEKGASKRDFGFHSFESTVFRPATRLRRLTKLQQIAFGIFISCCVIISPLYVPQWPFKSTDSLLCQNLPGANDVVVVMKTGATQIEDKLPIHLNTTMKCYRNSVIFSDHEEFFLDQYKVRDVLSNVDPALRLNHPDFELYRYVKTVGRQNLNKGDLTGTSSSRGTTPDQKHTIGGWVLDKWKFLPMLNETYHLYPNHQWYVFVETDTYLFWSTTLKYLSTLDAATPLFVGCQGTDKNVFAQGGSGYILSNPALKMFVDYFASNQTELDAFTESKWAGDYILGVVLDQAGIPLSPVWPIYQEHYFGAIDFGLIHRNKRFSCYPAGSYHHMTPEAVQELWNYEQDWIREENIKNDNDKFIRHGDVFSDYMLPRMRFSRYDWDNQCEEIRMDVETFEDCNTACVNDHACMQYMFDTNSLECKTLDRIRLGEGSLGSGIISDWIYDRVEEWRDMQPPCEGESFIYPDASVAPEDDTFR